MTHMDETIRVFPRRTKWTPTDELAFIGDPPLFLPENRDIPVRVSVAFTWDIDEGQRLGRAWSGYFSDVKVGGPAFGDPGGEFVPGRFLKEGVTITSRGCPNHCPWCHVPGREGPIRELPIHPGWIVQDNNLLACSDAHIEAVFGMLEGQRRRVFFNGGLDARLFTERHRELIDTIRVGELWFACDHAGALGQIERIAPILDGVPVDKRRCFVMIGYGDETLSQAEQRLETVYSLGFLPFCQLYQDENRKKWSPDWRALAYKWMRPAAYRKRGAE